MAIGAGLILPGIAPVGAGANDGQRRVSDSRFAAGGLDEDAAIVSGAQLAQSELGRGEVIDAGSKIGDFATNVATDQVELNLIERSGAGGRAEIDFAARIFSLPGDARGKVQELGYGLQIRRCISLGRDASGDGRKGSDSSLAHLGWHARRLQRWVDLEWQGLGGEIQEKRGW